MSSHSIAILHCISSLEVGGAERQLSILASAQARAGDRVEIAVVRGGPNQGILDEAAVATHHLPVARNSDPGLVLRFRRLIRDRRPDVLQTWLTQMDVVAGLAARLTGTPWILAERSSARAYPPSWKQRLRRTLARRSDLIIANSGGGLAHWQALAPAVPARVIGNAVPLERIRNAEPADLPAGSILFVGRLAVEKRVGSLLRAYAAADPLQVGPLLLCGDGAERPVLEQMAADLALGDRVRFLGNRLDVWSLLHGAAVVVNPSSFEGCPNAVIEAMAAARPVVVSDIPAHRELLTDEMAWLIDPDDSSAFGAALVAACTDQSQARTRIANAAVRVEDFGVPAIVAQYRDAYQSVLRARAGNRGA